jgi:hypothetical protein
MGRPVRTISTLTLPPREPLGLTRRQSIHHHTSPHLPPLSHSHGGGVVDPAPSPFLDVPEQQPNLLEKLLERLLPLLIQTAVSHRLWISDLAAISAAGPVHEGEAPLSLLFPLSSNAICFLQWV